METGETINTLVTFTVLSGGVQFVMEWVRGRFPKVDSDWVRLGSLLLGTGLALAYEVPMAEQLGLSGLPLSLDYLVTGIAIAFGAGFVGTLKNKMRAQDPNSSMYAEAVTPGHVAYFPDPDKDAE